MSKKKSCDIVFSIKACLFGRLFLFCNFEGNTIYITEILMLEPVHMARYLRNGNHVFLTPRVTETGEKV